MDHPQEEYRPDPYQHAKDQLFSDAYDRVEASVSDLTEVELYGLAGALVAELVNRGFDTETALQNIVTAVEGGAIGSRVFDQMTD
jgi:hypothetical protein